MASSGLTWRPTSRHMARIVNVSNILITDKQAKFMIKPLLMRLMRAECEGKDRNKIVFKYEEIVGILSKYIMKRRNSLFDHRIIRLARVHLVALSDSTGAKLKNC